MASKPWNSLAGGRKSTSPPLFSHSHLHSVFLLETHLFVSRVPSFYKDIKHRVEVRPTSTDKDLSLTWLYLHRTLFPNKIIFTSTGVEDFNISLGGDSFNQQMSHRIKNLNMFLGGSSNVGNLKTLILNHIWLVVAMLDIAGLSTLHEVTGTLLWNSVLLGFFLKSSLQ